MEAATVIERMSHCVTLVKKNIKQDVVNTNHNYS